MPISALPFFSLKFMAQNRTQARRRTNSLKKDITIMTLLANEATDGSRKILKKHNWPDAENHEDLEYKLAELYSDPNTDRVAMEKDMAYIHPHRKWLEKVSPPPAVKEDPKVTQNAKVVTLGNACGNPECACCQSKPSEPIARQSSFDGPVSSNTIQPRQITPLDYVGIIGVVGIIGLTIYAIKSHK